ncbi:hypothetical protein F0562_029226 [Nyssa sinensis]|uniref:Lon protease AAA+ ATPase lid domain-containing protein n=1 Tax=Nyssa sinensis TaxID=561372 RepID=A0A5J5B2A5_9ASTE|nr:hypothetical protein F0562_029226 [Nyssa sinensis]
MDEGCIIELLTYIDAGKKNFLWGLDNAKTETAPVQVEVTDAALLALIENYYREAAVRNLQKQIKKIYCKIALQLVRKGPSNERPIARVHVVLSNETTTESLSEFVEAEVGGATQVVAGSVEGSSNEMASETTEEAETVQSDFPADQI